MTLFSFLALALGMAAATADRVPRQAVVLIAVAKASRSARRVEQRVAVRRTFPVVRPARVRWDNRPLRRLLPPLRGTAAARAPGC